MNLYYLPKKTVKYKSFTIILNDKILIDNLVVIDRFIILLNTLKINPKNNFKATDKWLLNLFPDCSKMTIYRFLNKLVDYSLIRKIEGNKFQII